MPPSGLIGDAIRCLGFLSRLPLPRRWLDGAGDSPLAASARGFPLAGAALGVLAGAVLVIAYALRLPALTCGFLAVGALAAMTGALHEDGLGDAADGFFGAYARDRRLDIMKDSRIGTFAALTLIVWTGIKASLLAAVIERAGPGEAALALIGAEAGSRAAMLAFWHALPPARPGGLADRAGRPDWETVIAACGMGLVILVLTLAPVAGSMAPAAAVALTAAGLYGFARLSLAKIGGQTGDTLGAAQQIGALAILAGLVMTL